MGSTTTAVARPSASDGRGLAVAALEALGTVERHLGLATPLRPFLVDGSVAVCDAERVHPALDSSRLADPLVRRGTGADAVVVEAASSCDVVVVGKLSSSAALKARGYLVTGGGSALTVKVWRGQGPGPGGGEAERHVRRQMQAATDPPAPPVLADGRIGAVDFIVESVLRGRHPWSEEERTTAALELAPALLRMWQQTGVEQAPLDRVLSAGQIKRLGHVLRGASVVGTDRRSERRGLVRTVRRLVRRNLMLPCALAHGDLVATNIIRLDTGGHVLVDWEHGRHMPVAFDIVKLLLTSGRPLDLRRRLAGSFDDLGRGGDCYSWTEQLALGVCRMLTWAPDRRERAAAAGRLDNFDRERAAQIVLLATLLREED